MTLSTEEFARRLMRSRHWHLHQAGLERRAAASATIAAMREVERHEDEATRIAQQLRELGCDPQPPATPEAA